MQTTWNISSSPHTRDKWTTAFIMKCVLLALLPATVIGVVVNGWHALWVVLLATLSAVASEFLFDKLCHKPDTWKDGSAAVTGLMLALTLSPNVPLLLPVLGSMFAILVAKCCFGGLGKNFINPALAGRCFLMVSFGRAMADFSVDGVSAATPIAELMAGRAVNITRMFLGTENGIIGSSVLALMLGGLALWAFDFIHGQICFSVLGSFTLVMALLGGQGFDVRFLLAHLCGGGVVMGAFFMASDYVTSPVSRLGQTVYGVLIGVLGALFRLYGGTADAFSYSVIIGNLFTPLIDTYVIPKPYAFRKRALRAQQGDRVPFYLRIPRAVKVLVSIMLIAGLALSCIYYVTKDTIDEQQRAARAKSFVSVCPGAVSFDSDVHWNLLIDSRSGQPWGSGFGRAYINEALIGKNESGETVGYVISVTSADGFDGNVSLALGLDPDGKIYGVSFTELNETPGMGMRVNEDAFKNQFIGRSAERFSLNKAGGSMREDQIDSVSGASITSGAVLNAVNAGLDFFHTVVKGGDQ